MSTKLGEYRRVTFFLIQWQAGDSKKKKIKIIARLCKKMVDDNHK